MPDIYNQAILRPRTDSLRVHQPSHLLRTLIGRASPQPATCKITVLPNFTKSRVMTKTLLGNLAAFNSVLQLSLPNTQTFGGMSSGDSRQPDPNNLMNALVSGSVADHGHPDYSRYEPSLIWFHICSGARKIADSGFFRSSSYRAIGSYDPFMSRSQDRHSPPRAEFVESPTIDQYGSSRILPLYDPMPSRSVPYGMAATFSGPDSMSCFPREGLQRTAITENEPASRRQSQDSFGQRTGSPLSQGYIEYDIESHRQSTEAGRGAARYHSRRRPFNQDEFDGPSQYLPLPLPQQDHSRAQDLPELPAHLSLTEQDEVMRRANDILCECAFHFVAKYQFPVPLERDKPRIRSPADREWTEWAYLLKRLATKRRIPARVLYDNQIKQLVTTLENSIAARQSANKDQLSPKRKPKDDRYVLQLISAGTQVTRLLMDSLAMEQLNELYGRTEAVIVDRRHRI